jgi:uncharacterized protein
MMSRRAAARPSPRIAALMLILGAWTTMAWSQEAARPPAGEPAIPAAQGFVTDEAGILEPGVRARLEAFLDQVRAKTGAEFAVLVVKTTAPLSPSEYKVKVFERWGIGRKGHDDGLLMLVALDEREVRFETGYGLEGTLPDGLQSRIFRNQMADRFRAGDFGGGITAGVLACAQRIAAERGVTLEWDGRELRYDAPRRAARLPAWLPLVVFLLVVIVVSRLGRGFRGPRGGGWMTPGGGYWGGGFGGLGGGGFGGLGGGGFGGGSFGGFGGGASGGGGGGGRW